MRHSLGILVVSCVVLLTGCTTIVIISAPASLAIGDVAHFVLGVGVGPHGGTDFNLYAVAEVPDSWSLISHEYSGTVAGIPVSGTGSVVSQAYPDCTAVVRPGFQQIWIKDGLFSANTTDSGEVSLDFAVDDLPEGEVVVRFWLISSGDVDGSCDAQPAVATINRRSHRLRHVQAVSEGPLYQNNSLAITPNNEHLAIGGGSGPELVLFDRAPSTGTVEFVEAADNPDVMSLVNITIGPEGRTLYGADSSGNRLLVYSLGPPPEAMTLLQTFRDGVDGVHGLWDVNDVAISPDGTFAYASGTTSNAIAVFSRDPESGLLTYMTATGQFPWEPRKMLLSPDGSNLYVLSWWKILVFERDGESGLLSLVEIEAVPSFGGINLSSVDMSRSGEFLYVAGFFSGTGLIATFARDPISGELGLVQVISDADDGALGLHRPRDIVVAGPSVLVSSGEGSVAVFDRDPETGSLTFVEANFHGDGGLPELTAPFSLCLSPDGQNVYLGGSSEVQVFSLTLFADGFENGSTSLWSSAEP